LNSKGGNDRIKIQNKKQRETWWSVLGANKKFKDGLLRAIFNEPEKLIRLYNAITGKNLSGNTPAQIKTIKTVLLSKLRNDLSFIIDGRLVVLIEHQSTLNPNMPLRVLQYILLFYEIFCEIGKALYKTRQIMLPKPEFYVLYNGIEPYPPYGELRLSDAFMGMKEGEPPCLELIIKVVNINYGENEEVLKRCEDLNGYALFVAKIRKLQSAGLSLEEAVKNAAVECIKEGVLSEFLSNYKYKELINLIKLFYDEDTAIEIAKEEAYEEGIETLIERMLRKGKSVESIANDTDIPVKQIMEISERLMSVV
jgi:hypothetical protein